MTMPQFKTTLDRQRLPMSFVDSQRSALHEAMAFHQSRLTAHAADDDHDLQVAMQRRSERASEEIAAALERLDEDLYGVCVACQGEIQVERLKAVPHALLCSGCARF
jgi:DnaK suppressor protein